MCMFCAAIPVAATTGITLNGKQIEAKRKAESSATEKPTPKPIMQITAGVVIVLMIGSVTYHTLTYLP
jgi:hypothetical protein